MENLKIEDIVNWTGGNYDGKAPDATVRGISTDSRSIAPGELFIPLTGENFDGHDYIRNVLNAGAVAFLYSRPLPNGDGGERGIRVADTLQGYHDVARNYLKRFRAPVIAITGSNGKTTCKDMIANMLSVKYEVLKNEKNYNNEIGVPLTIMQMGRDKDVLILEMAMRGKGQIRQLARMAEPDVALITNIGEAHFELLGSREAIASAKSEVLEYLKPSGVAVLNRDDEWYDYLSEKSPARIVSFGEHPKSDYRLLSYRSLGLGGYEMNVFMEGEEYSFLLPLLGKHNMLNCLSAIATARTLGLSPEQIERGIARLRPSEKRMEIVEAPGGWVILNDTYNASPASTGKALEILGELDTGGRKIAVLADMLELGDIAVQAHLDTGALVQRMGIDLLFVKGNLGSQIAHGAEIAGMNPENIFTCRDNGDIVARLGAVVSPGDVILVKGSRLMKMEDVVMGLSGGVYTA